MKRNAYLVVFGIIAVIVVAAAISSFVLTPGTSNPTVNVSNLPSLGTAPNFQGIAAWINSPPLDISQLRGKVVLIDFWTYSCINCIRTIPYLNALYAKYGSDGLVIVGVHTPEFQFEKNYTNVVTAVKSFGIKYPVALDSNDATWNAYHNQYWPADYVVDANGTIRHTQFGEGDYNETESVIRELLQAAGYHVGTATGAAGTSVDFSQIGTPEIYVGYATARQPIGNSQGFSPGEVVNYAFTSVTYTNVVYFSGPWYNANDSMIAAGPNSKVYLEYIAKVVNIVAQGNSNMISIKLDGSTPSAAYVGSDVSMAGGVASATVSMARLYPIIDAPGHGMHELVITANQGFRLYTFTFG